MGRKQGNALVSELAPIDTQLFVYGTLLPGCAKEHQLAGLQETWKEAVVRGHLFEEGWGIAQGFSGIRLGSNAPEVTGWLFRSRDLPRHWERLDRFEGPGYRRVKVERRLSVERFRLLTSMNFSLASRVSEIGEVSIGCQQAFVKPVNIQRCSAKRAKTGRAVKVGETEGQRSTVR